MIQDYIHTTKDIPVFRIGNDIVIRWKIDLLKEMLDRAREEVCDICYGNLNLYFITGRGKQRVSPTDWGLDEDYVVWTFRGDKQKYQGVYSITLSGSFIDGEVFSVDYQDAFQLSTNNLTCEKGDAELEIRTTELVVKSSEQKVLPEIGNNGNWVIDGIDTGVSSRGSMIWSEQTSESISIEDGRYQIVSDKKPRVGDYIFYNGCMYAITDILSGNKDYEEGMCVTILEFNVAEISKEEINKIIKNLK